MRKARIFFSVLALVTVALIGLSCGGGETARQLQSITLSPASADAQDYPNGQVQFTAAGNYKTPPRTVNPLSANWGACYQSASTDAISVSRTGVAQCQSGAVGTFTVWADDPPTSGMTCLAVTACGGGCFIAGTAQLTCP